MRLPKLTNGAVIQARGRPIPRQINLHRGFTVVWTERLGDLWRSYRQIIWAETAMRAREAWDAWYEKNRRADAEEAGWRLHSWVVINVDGAGEKGQVLGAGPVPGRDGGDPAEHEP